MSDNRIGLWIMLLLISWLSLSCSSGSDSGEVFVSGYGHSENWANPAVTGTGDYHGSKVLAKDGIRADICSPCHGFDLDGGIAKISCYACHYGPSSSPGHPDGWDVAGDPLHFHGYYGKTCTISCSGCHGQTLSGGSGQSCFTCHPYDCQWNIFGPASSIFSGLAAKGPIANGEVTVYELTDVFSKRIGQALGRATTSLKDGAFLVDVGQYKGNVLVELNHGQYEDEATGTLIDNGLILRAVVAGASGHQTVAVTPLTEVAYQLALDSWDGLTGSNIRKANALVSKRLLGDDVVKTLPVFDDRDKAAQAQRDYGLILASISQMNVSKGYNVDEVTYFLFNDLVEDGELNQQTLSLLYAALQDFLKNPVNKTGIIDLNQTHLDEVWYSHASGDSGENLYRNHCAQCHGFDGTGLGHVPGVRGISSDEAISAHTWIETSLSEEDIQAIVEFLNQ